MLSLQHTHQLCWFCSTHNSYVESATHDSYVDSAARNSYVDSAAHTTAVLILQHTTAMLILQHTTANLILQHTQQLCWFCNMQWLCWFCNSCVDSATHNSCVDSATHNSYADSVTHNSYVESSMHSRHASTNSWNWISRQFLFIFLISSVAWKPWKCAQVLCSVKITFLFSILCVWILFQNIISQLCCRFFIFVWGRGGRFRSVSENREAFLSALFCFNNSWIRSIVLQYGERVGPQTKYKSHTKSVMGVLWNKQMWGCCFIRPALSAIFVWKDGAF